MLGRGGTSSAPAAPAAHLCVEDRVVGTSPNNWLSAYRFTHRLAAGEQRAYMCGRQGGAGSDQLTLRRSLPLCRSGGPEPAAYICHQLPTYASLPCLCRSGVSGEPEPASYICLPPAGSPPEASLSLREPRAESQRGPGRANPNRWADQAGQEQAGQGMPHTEAGTEGMHPGPASTRAP